jgi:hypothetical protein
MMIKLMNTSNLELIYLEHILQCFDDYWQKLSQAPQYK